MFKIFAYNLIYKRYLIVMNGFCFLTLFISISPQTAAL